MKGYILTLFIACSITLVLGQNVTESLSGPTNSTASTTAPAQFCGIDCRYNGTCLTTGLCRCYRGFVASKDNLGGNVCQKSFLDVGYGTTILTMRIIFSIFYFIELSLVTFRLYLEFTKEDKRTGIAPVFITRLILVILWIDIILQFFNNALDFRGIYGVTIPFAMQVLTYIEIPNLFFIFSILLAYWIDFYHAMIIKMKREQMLKKINSAYQSNLTYEDILAQITRMRKVKIFMGVMTIIGYALWIVFMFMMRFPGAGTRDSQTFLGLVTWFIFAWLLMGVGFVIFGTRLAGIMPTEMSGKIRRLTHKVICVAVVLIICNAFGFAINVKSIPGPDIFLAKTGVAAVLGIIARGLAIDIYLPFVNIARWLSFGWSRATSSRSGTNSGSKSGSVEHEMKENVEKVEIQAMQTPQVSNDC